MKINLYHGTSSKLIEKISTEGFINGTYLTSSYEQAQYYAECASEEDESKPIILIASIDTLNLKADLPSFNEPLTYTLDEHDLTEEEWHEGIEDNSIPYPKENDWQTSLKYVSSIYHPKPILVEQIDFSENVLSNEDDNLTIKAINEPKTKIKNKKIL